MRTTRVLAVIFGGLTLQTAGCAEEGDLLPEDLEARELPILAEVEIARGHTIYFFAGEEEGVPLTAQMSEVAPSGAPSVMAAVEERSATTLEVFLAVSPDGTQPPDELVASHALEVEASGRDSDEVKPFVLPDVENRTRSSDCDTYSAFVDWWLYDLGNTNDGYHYASGTSWLTTGPWYSYSELGGCNKNGSSKDFSAGRFCDGWSFWIYGSAVPVSAGSMYHTTFNNYPDDCNYSVKVTYPGGATGNARLIIDPD